MDIVKALTLNPCSLSPEVPIIEEVLLAAFLENIWCVGRQREIPASSVKKAWSTEGRKWILFYSVNQFIIVYMRWCFGYFFYQRWLETRETWIPISIDYFLVAILGSDFAFIFCKSWRPVLQSILRLKLSLWNIYIAQGKCLKSSINCYYQFNVVQNSN